ncbi:MAG: AI-2E family transporter [Deltaproteobacteria bacterium]|nr:AI-2E family transporter [Deltaproteobacteria bacterium]
MPNTTRKKHMESEKHVSLKLFLGLGLFFMLAFILINLKIIILPMLLAFFITCLLNPVVILIQRLRVPRMAAIVLTLFLGIYLLWLALNFVIVNIADFQEGIPKYREKFLALVDRAIELRNAHFRFLTLDMIKDQLSAVSFGGIISWLFSYLFSFTGYFFLTVIFLLYFLPALPAFPEKLKKAFPGSKGVRLCETVEAISRKIQTYIVVKSLVSLGMGLMTGFICYLFGIEFASTWGIFAFLLNFVPTVGAILSVLLPVLFALLQLGPVPAVWLAVALAIPSAAVQNFAEPMVLGRSVNISPVTALMAILLWSVLWGGMGAIVAVPVTAVMKLTFDNFGDLKPVGTLMGN